MRYTIYHNPRCSKSRETLKLLQGKGIDPVIIEYLKTPLSVAQLAQLGEALGKTPLEWMRVKEARFKELGLKKTDERDHSEWYAFMAENPILIERPIVEFGGRAELGRPPENVLRLL